MQNNLQQKVDSFLFFDLNELAPFNFSLFHISPLILLVLLTTNSQCLHFKTLAFIFIALNLLFSLHIEFWLFQLYQFHLVYPFATFEFVNLNFLFKPLIFKFDRWVFVSTHSNYHLLLSKYYSIFQFQYLDVSTHFHN